MKKALMMAVALTVFAAPAMANEEKLQEKVDMKFSETDTNKDGMISKSEHDAKGEEMFKDADTNSDGSLSKDEVKAEMEKKMEKMKDHKDDK